MIAGGDIERLAEIFRRELGSQVEYSFTIDPRWWGIMVIGRGDHFLAKTAWAAQGFDRTERWSATAAQLVRRLTPDVIGFRADCHDATVERATVYLRLPMTTSECALNAALSVTAPDAAILTPHRLAHLVGAPAPSIISLRLARSGEMQMSIYCDLPPSRKPLITRVESVVRELALPASVSDQVESMLTTLDFGTAPSVLGIDLAARSDDRAVKLDIPNPPVDAVLAALRRLPTPDRAREQLVGALVTLRRQTCTYFGVKFGAAGFEGWKAYIQVWRSSQSSGRLEVPRLILPDDPGAN